MALVASLHTLRPFPWPPRTSLALTCWKGLVARAEQAK